MDEHLPAPTGIPAAEWATTPARVRACSIAVRARLPARAARRNQPSQHASQPPSADPPGAPPRPTTTPRGWPRGGQPGHPGRNRDRLPPDQVDELVPCHPDPCPACQTALALDLPAAAALLRPQVWAVPPIRPTVTDYHPHAGAGPHGQRLVRGTRPADAPPGGAGSHATALVGLRCGGSHRSDRRTQALRADVCGLPIGVGRV